MATDPVRKTTSPTNTKPDLEELGPAHFKVFVDRDGSLRIERWGNAAKIVWLLLVLGAVAAVVWQAPGLELNTKILFSGMAVFFATIFVALLLWQQRYEQGLGPYLVADRAAIHLRRGIRIPLADVAAIEVRRETFLEDRVSRLFVNLRSGESHAVVASVIRSEIERARSRLVEWLAERGYRV